MALREPIHREAGWPLALLVQREIMAKIADGTYPVGSRLPPERLLAERFSVSRKTVRGALAQLETDGRITRHVGRGTFVEPEPSSARHRARLFLHVGIVFLKYTEPFSDPLTRRLFEGIHEVLRARGAVATTYGLTCVQGDDYDALVQDMTGMDFDAVILAPEPTAPALRKLCESMTVLQVGYHLPGEAWNFVAGDLESGLRQAVRGLFELDHRRMAFLSTLSRVDADNPGMAHLKVRAFEKAVCEIGGGRIESTLFWQSDWEAFLRARPRPTALITAQTGQARAVLRRAAELGIGVPEDFSLISFDDGDIGTQTTPQFSGIRVLTADLGRRGAEGLLEMIANERKGPLQITMEPELILRESCARAPAVSD